MTLSATENKNSPSVFCAERDNLKKELEKMKSDVELQHNPISLKDKKR